MDANSRLLRRALDAAIAAARPPKWLGPALEEIERPAGRTIAIALGKAAIGMAEFFAARWGAPFDGLAVAPLGAAAAVAGFRVMEAAHPVPDATSLAAGEAALELAARAGPEDLLLILLSGGASALACAPIPGVTLEIKAELTRRLLASGLEIGVINRVRQQVSRLKGGGLGRVANGAMVVTIAQSDVPQDALWAIGSAPGLPLPADPEYAIETLQSVAPDLVGDLEGPIRDWAECADPVEFAWRGEVAFGAGDGARAAAALMAAEGVSVDDAGSHWSVDAALAAQLHAADLETMDGQAMVTAGETSVAVAPGSTGRGGRNQHFLLALAIALAGRTDVWALAADTDGIDGSSNAAGAWLDPDLLGGLDVSEAEGALAAFDAHGFFEKHGRLIETGPTGVNVGDLRLVLVA